MTIQIMHMSHVPRDVSIDVVGDWDLELGDIRVLYDLIKNRAIQHVRHTINEGINCRKRFDYIVEMEENNEGLPTANIFRDGVIDEKFFATRSKNNEQ
ncbi:MAG TPA: hypothetical protein EYQ21_02420 [Flavobacteriales bacterium]|nr:hypothetical protein [Flavobacteriales bacterium]